MGGDEDPRRASHESYRPGNSFAIETPELVKKSVDRVRSITRHKKFSPKRHASQGSFSSYKNKKRESSSTIDKKRSDEEEEAKKKQMIQPIPGITLKAGYLLVSPLQGWVNTLATMWSATSAGRDTISENEMKLAIDPTLALFGDGDVFVSVKRLHAWAEKLANAGKGGGSQFRYREVANAGHFWHDHEAVKVLQDEIKSFVSTL